MLTTLSAQKTTKNIDLAAEQIRNITGPRGAGLVLDCVGVQPTVDLGAKLQDATASGLLSALVEAITIFITAALRTAVCSVFRIGALGLS